MERQSGNQYAPTRIGGENSRKKAFKEFDRRTGAGPRARKATVDLNSFLDDAPVDGDATKEDDIFVPARGKDQLGYYKGAQEKQKRNSESVSHNNNNTEDTGNAHNSNNNYQGTKNSKGYDKPGYEPKKKYEVRYGNGQNNANSGHYSKGKDNKHEEYPSLESDSKYSKNGKDKKSNKVTEEFKVGVHESVVLRPTNVKPVTSQMFDSKKNVKKSTIGSVYVNNYSEYLPEEEWKTLVNKKEAFVSIIRVHPHFKDIAFVKIPGQEDEVIIEGMKDRNRAFDDDEVVFKIKPKNEWKTMEIPVVTREVIHKELRPENNMWKFYSDDEEEKENEEIDNNVKDETENDTPIEMQTKMVKTAYVIAISKRNLPDEIPGILMINTDKFLLGNTAIFIPRMKKLPCFVVPNPLNEIGTKHVENNLYIMKFVRWSISQYLPFGSIIKSLGTLQNIDSISKVILLSQGFTNYYDFQEIATEELSGRNAKDKPSEKDIDVNNLDMKVDEEQVIELANKLEAEDPAIKELAGYTASIVTRTTEDGKTETELQTPFSTEKADSITDPKELSEYLLSCWDPTKRRDFRDLTVITIDPLTARDFDDALSIEILKDSNDPEEAVYRVGVHIADVTCYVKDGMVTDDRAQDNTTTIYLQHKCYNMLPGRLSEDLCSLNPQVIRRTYSCLFLADGTGRILSCAEAPNECVQAPSLNNNAEPVWFGRGIISSSARLTYDAAQAILDGEFDGKSASELSKMVSFGENTSIEEGKGLDVIKSVKCLWKVAEGFRKGHLSKCLNVSAPETRFDIDPVTLEPRDFKVKPLQNANFLVEEMMIACNQLVARRLIRSFPTFPVLRLHPQPSRMKDFIMKFKTSKYVYSKISELDAVLDLKDGAALSRSLKEASIDFKKNVNAKAKAYNDRCLANRGNKIYEALGKIVIPKMLSTKDAYNVLSMGFVVGHLSRARYACYSESPEGFVHWGIHVPLYMHFTSPIRRYPDDICHRQLTAALEVEHDCKIKTINSVLRDFNDNKLSKSEALQIIKSIVINGKIRDEVGRGHSLRFENSAKLYGPLPENQKLDPELTLAAFTKYSEMFGDEEADKFQQEFICSSLEGVKEAHSKQVDLGEELDEKNYSKNALDKISRMKGNVGHILEQVDINNNNNNNNDKTENRKNKHRETNEKDKKDKTNPEYLRIIDAVEGDLKSHGLDVALMDAILKKAITKQKLAASAENMSTDFFMWKYWTGKFRKEGHTLGGFSTYTNEDGSTRLLTMAYVVGTFDKEQIFLYSPRLNISYSIDFCKIPCASVYTDPTADGSTILRILGWDIAKGLVESNGNMEEQTAEVVKEKLEAEKIKPKTKRSILLGVQNQVDGEEEEEEEEEEDEIDESKKGKNNNNNNNTEKKSVGPLYDVAITHFTPLVCEFVLEQEYRLDGMCKLIPFVEQPFLELTPAKTSE